MTEVPLFDTPINPDAGHNVRAPGGYEWWYFDAEDTAANVQIVAILLDGFVFHPGYLRAHARWARNPTRIAPPLPREYPCAYFILYEHGRIAAQFMTQFPPGALTANDEVTVGPNRFWRDGDTLRLELSGTPWHLTGRGPQLIAGTTLAASWTLRPRLIHTPTERTFLSKAMTGADHRWIVADPLCDFSADVSLGDRRWQLRGQAYHDHNYGTGPLGPGLRRWTWGRALLGDRVYAFHYAVPQSAGLPPEVHLLRGLADGPLVDVGLQPRDVSADWTTGATSLGLPYARRLVLGDVMTLNRPRVVDLSPFYLRLVYDAVCEGRAGQAFCEVAYPHRLRWPVLGRMIEMSIHRPPQAPTSSRPG